MGIANIAVKVPDLEASRKFYTGVVGLEEASETRDPAVSPANLSCFKVNDSQYVEVSPTLKDPAEDRLIRIGFETTDARQLSAYLTAKGVKTPPKITKDANGNLSFPVQDPVRIRVSVHVPVTPEASKVAAASVNKRRCFIGTPLLQHECGGRKVPPIDLPFVVE